MRTSNDEQMEGKVEDAILVLPTAIFAGDDGFLDAPSTDIHTLGLDLAAGLFEIEEHHDVSVLGHNEAKEGRWKWRHLLTIARASHHYIRCSPQSADPISASSSVMAKAVVYSILHPTSYYKGKDKCIPRLQRAQVMPLPSLILQAFSKLCEAWKERSFVLHGEDKASPQIACMTLEARCGEVVPSK